MNYITERRIEEKERRREEILDAAEIVFSEKGVDAATMDMVAKQARVSRALVYVYFKDKTALHQAICIRGLGILRQMFEQARLTHKTGAEQVRAIGFAYMQFAEQYPTHFAALSRFETQAMPDPAGCDGEGALEMIQAGTRVHQETVLALVQGKADRTLRQDIDNPMMISITLWGFIHGTIQLTQTKTRFIEGLGFSKLQFMQESMKFGMQALVACENNRHDSQERPL